jgi:hypothetical protein
LAAKNTKGKKSETRLYRAPVTDSLRLNLRFLRFFAAIVTLKMKRDKAPTANPRAVRLSPQPFPKYIFRMIPTRQSFFEPGQPLRFFNLRKYG